MVGPHVAAEPGGVGDKLADAHPEGRDHSRVRRVQPGAGPVTRVADPGRRQGPPMASGRL